MNQIRPKNLNLFTIRFPLPAIVSILHRVSGAFLFLMIPVMIWLLGLSLTIDGFDTLQRSADSLVVKFAFWVLLAPFCYHLVAGLRHLLMDVHLGVTLKGSKRAALLTFAVSALLILLAGVWLW